MIPPLEPRGVSGPPLLAILITLTAVGGPVAIWGARAHAQWGAVAEVEAPPASGTRDDPTAAATTIYPEDDPGALSSTEDLLEPVPGARVRRSGSWGGFSGLSLRGANLEHTRVLLDLLPLDDGTGAAFDFSAIPPALLGRIEVYRSGAPIWLGGGGLGGVVRLVPSATLQSHVEVALGLASFGTREARFTGASRSSDGERAWLVTAGGRLTDGDFPFRDDGGTILDRRDDREALRQNGQLTEGWGLAHFQTTLGTGELRMLAWAFERAGGVPGSAVREPIHVRRNEGDYFGSAAWTGPLLEGAEGEPRLEARVVVAGGMRRRRFVDRFAEVSLTPRAANDVLLQTHIRTDLRFRATPWLSIEGTAGHRRASLSPEDTLARNPNTDSARDELLTGIEARAIHARGPWRGEARASASAQGSWARLTGLRPDDALEIVEARWRPNARLSLFGDWRRQIAMSASISTAHRLPSLVELFGDRGYLVGAVELRPERGWAADVGFALQQRTSRWQARLEVRGFMSRLEDLISYVRSAQLQLVPQNVGHAEILGAEIGGSGRIGPLSTELAWTLLHSRDRDRETALPLRPIHQAYGSARITSGSWGSLGPIWAAINASFVGANFVDPANRARIPARLVVGGSVGVSWLRRRLELRLSVRDIFDERPFDYVGFPLPGRRFAAELVWREPAR